MVSEKKIAGEWASVTAAKRIIFLLDKRVKKILLQ